MRTGPGLELVLGLGLGLGLGLTPHAASPQDEVAYYPPWKPSSDRHRERPVRVRVRVGVSIRVRPPVIGIAGVLLGMGHLCIQRYFLSLVVMRPNSWKSCWSLQWLQRLDGVAMIMDPDPDPDPNWGSLTLAC